MTHKKVRLSSSCKTDADKNTHHDHSHDSISVSHLFFCIFRTIIILIMLRENLIVKSRTVLNTDSHLREIALAVTTSIADNHVIVI